MPNAVMSIDWLIIFGVLILKKTEVVLYLDESKEYTVDELHIITTFYVNGIESCVEARVFYGFNMEFWMEEESDEIVEDIYPCIKKYRRE